MHATLELVSGVLRVYAPGASAPEPYCYVCNVRAVAGKREACELFGVLEAPTKDQLRAIHTALKEAGFKQYIRRLGDGRVRRWRIK